MTNELWVAHRAQAQRYFTMLPVNDMGLLVLKGHLMVESFLSEIVECACQDRSQIPKARLRFHQLYLVARALTPMHLGERIWDGVEELNAFRNALAHNLEPADVEKRAAALLAKVIPFHHEFVDFPADLNTRTGAALAAMIARLSLVPTASRIPPEEVVALVDAEIDTLAVDAAAFFFQKP